MARLWCDSEGDGRCELGDSPICPGASGNPGYVNEITGQSLHKIAEARPKNYPLRGQPRVRFDVDSRDAFGNDDDWATRQHRPMLVDELVALHLWPCSTHPGEFCPENLRDIENCEELGDGPCHVPGFGSGFDLCWHINCGAAVHGADTGTYMFCHIFNPGRCRKIKMPVQYRGHRERLRHVIGGAIPNNCYPWMNLNCWGQNVDEDSPEGYHLQDDWQRWSLARLQWDGEAKFREVPGDATIELRNKALAMLQADPARFNADQIWRPDGNHNLPYTLDDVDEWWRSWNDADPREPRGDLPVIDTVEGVVLRMRDVPVQVELVAVSSKVTLSLQIVRLKLNPDVRDPSGEIGEEGGGPYYYPMATIKVQMTIRPRVTIDPEHGVTVLQDVYAVRGPVFDPPDALHYPDGWRPPQTLEWWGALGPYSEPRFERMRIERGGESFVCTELRRALSGQEIGGMETDWSRLDGDERLEPEREVYRGKVTIQRIGE